MLINCVIDITQSSKTVVPKVGDTALLRTVRTSWGRWSRNGRLGAI